MAEQKKKQKLYVRFSNSADVQAVSDFYKTNEHEYVAQRDPDAMKKLIENGAVTVIEDGAGVIQAVSVSYPLLDEQGEHKWTEIGSTRVALSGMGLFETMFSAQILRAFLLEPPTDRFAIEIDVANTDSKKAFTRAGCQPYQIPQGLRDLAEANMSPEDRGVPVDWYQFGIEGIPDLAQKLIDKLDNPDINQDYELDFSRCQIVTLFEQQLRQLATKDYGNHKKPDPNKGLRDQRNKFHKGFKL